MCCRGRSGCPQELKEELVDALRAAILEDACAVRAMWDEPQPFFAEYRGDRVWSEAVGLDDLYEPAFVSTVV